MQFSISCPKAKNKEYFFHLKLIKIRRKLLQKGEVEHLFGFQPILSENTSQIIYLYFQ